MEEILLRIHAGQQTLQWRHDIVNKTAPAPLAQVKIHAHSDLERYGQNLYDKYLRGTLFEKAMASSMPVILRVYDENDQWWELLHDGDKHLAIEQVVILRMPSSDLVNSSVSIDRPPLRILVTTVSTSPGTKKAQPDEIEAVFRRLERNNPGMIEVTLLRNPSRIRWMRAIDDAVGDGKPFHIWHYAGEQLDTKTLQLDGSTATIEQINALFSSQNTLKVISLDFSERQIQSENFRLLTAPFVIVPQAPTQAESLSLFFRFFYDSIGSKDLAQALLNARQKVFAYSVGDVLQSTAITVFSRTIDYEIFSRPHPDEKNNPIMIRNQVFVSYSHRDETWCKRLMSYLDPLRQSHVIRAWVDSDIEVGSDWFDEIQKGLAQAKVAVLLASPEFFRSQFIQTHEMPYILEQRRLGNCTVVWVAVSAYTYEFTSLNAIQAAHPPHEPLDRLSNTAADDVLLKIVRLVAAALKEN